MLPMRAVSVTMDPSSDVLFLMPGPRSAGLLLNARYRSLAAIGYQGEEFCQVQM